MNALLVPVEEDIFSLYSGCLGGIDGEIIYDYWKNGKDTEFPHDEFNCALLMESDSVQLCSQNHSRCEEFEYHQY